MNARTRSLVGVGIMTLLLALYFFFVGVRAVALLSTASPLAIAMGAALIVLPLLGVWALARELLFGYRSTRLVDRLASAGRLPEESVDTLPSGKPDREQADAVFPKYRAEVEADPGSWETWARLGIVYDACGDRKRAREALREAIAVDRARS